MESTTLLPTAEAGPRPNWSFSSMVPNTHYIPAAFHPIESSAKASHSWIHRCSPPPPPHPNPETKEVLYVIKKRKELGLCGTVDGNSTGRRSDQKNNKKNKTKTNQKKIKK